MRIPRFPSSRTMLSAWARTVAWLRSESARTEPRCSSSRVCASLATEMAVESINKSSDRSSSPIASARAPRSRAISSMAPATASWRSAMPAWAESPAVSSVRIRSRRMPSVSVVCCRLSGSCRMAGDPSDSASARVNVGADADPRCRRTWALGSSVERVRATAPMSDAFVTALNSGFTKRRGSKRQKEQLLDTRL